MKKSAWLALALLLASCTAVEKKSILLDVEPATPLDQRDLHKHCDLGDSAACTLALANAAGLAAHFAIIQGIAPSDRAVFSALVPKAELPTWFLYERDLGRLWKIVSLRTQSRPKSSWAVQRVEVRNLEPGRAFELLAADSAGHLLEDRFFRTLSAGENNKVKIAFASNLRKLPAPEAEQLIASIHAKEPQLIVLRGGTVDATIPKQKKFTKKSEAQDHFFESHSRARAALPLARQQWLTPVAANWNEEEYGGEPANRAFIYRDQARETFETFFPHWADEIEIIDGPGLALSFQLGEQQFALLDELSFRKPLPPLCAKKPKLPECVLPAGWRFGTLQANWLQRQTTKFNRPFWILAGNLAFGAYNTKANPPAQDAIEWLASLEKSLFGPQASEAPFSSEWIETQPKGSSRRTTCGLNGNVLGSQELSPLQ